MVRMLNIPMDRLHADPAADRGLPGNASHGGPPTSGILGAGSVERAGAPQCGAGTLSPPDRGATLTRAC